MRCFLRMLNQLNEFSPHLAERTKPIRDLLLNKKQWYWGPNQDKPFPRIERIIMYREMFGII